MKKMHLRALLGTCVALGVCARVSALDVPPSLTQATNLSHTLDTARAGGSLFGISAYAIDGAGDNGPAGSVQPGIALWDWSTGRLVASAQINRSPAHFDTADSNAGHDAPDVVPLAHGGTLVTYGAMSTYRGYHPPQAWACQDAVFCQPFKFAPPAANANDLIRALSASPEYHLPTIGLSEASSVTRGDVSVIAGQEQTTSALGVPGTQGYVTYHATGASSGYFDTTHGPYDFHAPIAEAGDGLTTLTLPPKDNAYFEFAIWSAPAQREATITITVGAQRCALTIGTGEGNPAAIASTYVDAFNGARTPECAPLRARLLAVRPVHDIDEYHGSDNLAEQTVGFDLRDGDVEALSAPRVACDDITCNSGSGDGNGPNTVLDLRDRGYAEHRHFLFGGMIEAGGFIYELLDVQQVTHSWYGAGHSSLALALACFRSRGPAGSTWTWTDCAGRHPFLAAPGIRPAYRLGTGAHANDRPASPYLIGPPRSGAPSTMIPFSYDYGMERQPRGPHGAPWWPVISAEALTVDGPDHLRIAYQCFDTSGHMGICALRYDTRSGESDDAGFVDMPEGGGSLAALAFAKRSGGPITLGALVGDGDRWGLTSGAWAMTYALRGSHWERRAVHSFGGRNNAAAPGVVASSADGRRLFFQSLIDEPGARSMGFYACDIPS